MAICVVPKTLIIVDGIFTGASTELDQFDLWPLVLTVNFIFLTLLRSFESISLFLTWRFQSLLSLRL